MPADTVPLLAPHTPCVPTCPTCAEEEEAAVVDAARQRGVDPEQLALLEDQFDAQDEDGDGALVVKAG